MILFTKLDTANVVYSIKMEEEDLPLRGNVMNSGNADHDRAAEDEIFQQLVRGGNPWAWCMVRVTATVGPLTGTAQLGCCSYPNEAAFRRCDYFEDMKDDALSDLIGRATDLGWIGVDDRCPIDNADVLLDLAEEIDGEHGRLMASAFLEHGGSDADPFRCWLIDIIRRAKRR